MTIDQIISKIKPSKWFTVSEINDLGVFLDSNGKPSMFIIYRLIRKGRLPYQDVGASEEPRYLVQGKDLIAELKRRYQVK